MKVTVAENEEKNKAEKKQTMSHPIVKTTKLESHKQRFSYVEAELKLNAKHFTQPETI